MSLITKGYGKRASLIVTKGYGIFKKILYIVKPTCIARRLSIFDIQRKTEQDVITKRPGDEMLTKRIAFKTIFKRKKISNPITRKTKDVDFITRKIRQDLIFRDVKPCGT
jgi:hypothetical protein